jgi:hypothetical protein
MPTPLNLTGLGARILAQVRGETIPVFNVRDSQFAGGAKGDGVTNDTAAIQAAADAAAGSVLVFFPPGNYRVTSVRPPDSGLRVVGNGATLTHIPGSVDPIFYRAQSPRTLISGFYCSGLRFQGDATATVQAQRLAIWLIVAEDVVIEDCEFRDFISAAIQIGDSRRVWIRNNRVFNCAFASSMSRNAIGIKGTQSGFIDPTSADATGDTWITGNYVEGNMEGAGIAVVQPEAVTHSRCVVSNNIVRGPAVFGGITVEAGYAINTLVQGNQVYNCGHNFQSGIQVAVSTRPTPGGDVVKRNIVADNIVDSEEQPTAKGITLYGGKATISGNVVRSSMTGITVVGDATSPYRADNVAVTGNQVTLCNTDSTDANRPMGITLLTADNVSLSGNVVTMEPGGFSKDGIHANDVIGFSISGGQINGMGRHGVNLAGSAKNGLVSGVHILNPNTNGVFANGIHIAAATCDNISIKANRCEDNRGTVLMRSGIDMAAAATNVRIEDNDILNFTFAMILVAAGTPLVNGYFGMTPEGNLIAAVGSMVRRLNGGAATTLYVKESGTGNTGWVAK